MGIIVARRNAGFCKRRGSRRTRTGFRGQVRVSTGAGLQQFLSQAPYFVGGGRGEESVPAGVDANCRAAISERVVIAWDRSTAKDVNSEHGLLSDRKRCCCTSEPGNRV